MDMEGQKVIKLLDSARQSIRDFFSPNDMNNMLSDYKSPEEIREALEEHFSNMTASLSEDEREKIEKSVFKRGAVVVDAVKINRKPEQIKVVFKVPNYNPDVPSMVTCYTEIERVEIL